jgi:hypothetical protein
MSTSIIRGASPLGLPHTLSRAPLAPARSVRVARSRARSRRSWELRPSGKTKLALLILVAAASLSAQVPLGKEALEVRTHEAMAALDRYLETWNSRDPKRWASSLHFPHVRPGPGAFELSQTPEQYAAGVNFKQTLATGWHHSEWTSRRVLHVGLNQAHVAGSWTRYTEDDRPLVGSDITYIVTNQGARWGVLSRFAAGQSGLDAAAAAANGTAARKALETYFAAINRHDLPALTAAVHYPHVRIADGAVEISRTAAEFGGGSEPGRLRTWFETRIDRIEVVQTSANGVNIALTYSRRDRSGRIMSTYDAIILVVRRDDGWRVQAISTI